MPQNPFLVATKTVTSSVYLFDMSRHDSKPPPDGKCMPDLILTGHENEGYGLAWSPVKEGLLISGSDDKQICLWDINATTKQSKELAAKQIFKKHTNVVEDVAWHLRHEYMFASVGDDNKLIVWDTRKGKDSYWSPRGM